MENPEKCSKEKRDEVMLKVAKALKKIFEKHESITTAHIYGAQEDVTYSEDESEGEDETTGDEPEWEDEPEKEDEPSDLELAWEVLELAKNAYTKIVETSHSLKKVHTESTLSDIYLTLGEVSIEAENFEVMKETAELKALMVATTTEGQATEHGLTKEVEEQNAVINTMEQEMDADTKAKGLNNTTYQGEEVDKQMDTDTKAKGPNNTTYQGEEVDEQNTVINAREKMDTDTKAKGPNNTTYQGEEVDEQNTVINAREQIPRSRA